MSRARQQKATANNGQRVESTRGDRDVLAVNCDPEHVQRPKNPVSRHPSILPPTARLMAACDARRVTLGKTYSDVARDAELDRADVYRALSLKEEPTTRTLGRLCEYFNVADVPALSHRERQTAVLNQLRAVLERQAKLLGELAALAASDPPEL